MENGSSLVKEVWINDIDEESVKTDVLRPEMQELAAGQVDASVKIDETGNDGFNVEEGKTGGDSEPLVDKPLIEDVEKSIPEEITENNKGTCST